jgi:replication-associated recombination protein RarA
MELHRMEERLDPGKPGQKGVVLCGIGGYGKTQTTLRFIMKNKELYSAFIWINALTIELTKQSFSEAADLIASNWPSRDVPMTYTGSSNWKKVITRLRTTRHSRWLLVIDSVDDLNLEKYTQYIPSCEHGSIIVTSTQTQASEVFRMPKLDIDSLDPRSSRELLIARVFGPAKEVDPSNTSTCSLLR